jgi:hypothetical protein
MGHREHIEGLLRASHDLEATIGKVERYIAAHSETIPSSLTEALRDSLSEMNRLLMAFLQYLAQLTATPLPERKGIPPYRLEIYPSQTQPLVEALFTVQNSLLHLQRVVHAEWGAIPYDDAQRLIDSLNEMDRQLEAYLRRLPRLTEAAHVQAKKAAEPYEPSGIVPLPGGGGLLVKLRLGRNWERRVDVTELEAPKDPEDQPEISVFAYLDTDDKKIVSQISAHLDELVDILGYEGPHDVEVDRGSFIRRSRAFLLRGLSSSEVRERLVKVERALELVGLDVRQAEVDVKTADAVAKLLTALNDIDRAVVRAGSVLLIKYATPQGPVVLTRTLSQLEIRALEKYPEIQLNPEHTLRALATAVDTLITSSGDKMLEGG